MNSNDVENMMREIEEIDLSQHRDSVWDSGEITAYEARQRILGIIRKYAEKDNKQMQFEQEG